MYIDLNPDQRRLQRELREYFRRLVTPELRARVHAEPEGGPAYREVMARLGADGWLGIGWPTEYGGQGRTMVEQFILFEEAYRARSPFPMIAVNTVGPALMAHGTPEQKQRYLPRILRGEIDFAIGYSEPEAGTDLASLTTSARRDGDSYIVNGTKVFTSRGGSVDYIWLAARTGSVADRHRGISVLIIPTSDPGFRATPIHTLAGHETYLTHYDNIRVPAENLVGAENEGWRIITTQLNHERVAMAAFGATALELFERTVAWLRAPEQRRRPLVSQPWVWHNVARAFSLLEAMKLLNWQAVFALAQQKEDPGNASAVKVYSTETVLEVYRLLLDVVGPAGLLTEDSPGAVLAGDLEWAYRRAVINTFGGGTNEVQREIIARTALGMPRVRY
jgi:hypothetical protein